MTTHVNKLDVIPDVFEFTEQLAGIEHYVHRKNGLQVLLLQQTLPDIRTVD